LLGLALVGCESLSYYGQAARGQLALMWNRESIAALLKDPALDPALRERLDTFLQLRAFAAAALHLPTGHSYETLVRQNTPFVTWSVFAAPEFSLVPRQWCYPVAGCVSYRGYFKEASARQYAAALSQQGWEVYVGGVSAYSTLGWFNDPLLSSMLERDTWQLASILFHELAHQKVYAPGDTEFNESFATAVEQEGLRRWLESSSLDDAARASVWRVSVQDAQRRESFVALVQGAVQDLSALYATEHDTLMLRQAKQTRLEQLRRDYATLKAKWDGDSSYDNWFKQPLNNAQLATVATYNTWVPAFAALLAQQQGDLDAFYREVTALAALDQPTRHARLNALLAAP
jgi:predicted aminopeptidase